MPCVDEVIDEILSDGGEIAHESWDWRQKNGGTILTCHAENASIFAVLLAKWPGSGVLRSSNVRPFLEYNTLYVLQP